MKETGRGHLVQRFSDISLGSKDKHSKRLLRLLMTGETMTALEQKILETLKYLSPGELERFRHVVQYSKMKEGLPRIPRQRMEMADRGEIAKLMVETYGEESVEVTKEVLKMISRTDLVQRFSDISSGSKGPSRSLELEGCGSMMQDPSDWTKLEPEVNSTDADEVPTYSLQSEAGRFECSVSGLRWFCKEKVSFKYQFCSWEEPMERMESIQYMPAGPLIDITAVAGKLDEIYLPHWICIDDIPKISNRFAVLHIDDCGHVVEKVSEVTPSHVKLPEPVFSPRAVLMKAGAPVRWRCKVLIYKTDTAFLTLHVYLIPHDPALQEAMDKKESSYGYKQIRKPHPEKSLKMGDRFILTADLDGAKLSPEYLKLRYECRDPNFFEVYIENPDRHFTLSLTQKNERQPVWTSEIRKDEYQSTGRIQGEHFVDKHLCQLIERVVNIGSILDNLLEKGVIQQEEYDTIRAAPTTQEKMRKLCRGPLKAGGHAAKDIFYQILEEKEKYLVADLQRKES
ncbi:NACHT, LRR and PYD domains-containing protein 1 homolog [Chaetodon auriga]|uniref:NACHT, LRR and PYD domains-containing protein 1 homolog n=1 Tax=Chaetodon auriga TaxID=39042 RepID=UPI0040329F08